MADVVDDNSGNQYVNFYMPLRAKLLDLNQVSFDDKIKFEFSIKKCVPAENKKCAKNEDNGHEFDIQISHEISKYNCNFDQNKCENLKTVLQQDFANKIMNYKDAFFFDLPSAMR